MPPVSDLNGLRNRPACGFGVDATAVSADDLGARMLSQPPGYRFGFTIRQQVDDPALFQIAQDRTVAVTLPPGPVIDPKHAWRCHWCSSGSMMELTQQGRSTGQQPEPGCQPFSGPTTYSKREPV